MPAAKWSESGGAIPLWMPMDTAQAAEPPTDRGPLDQALRDYILLITILVPFLVATAQDLKPFQSPVLMSRRSWWHWPSPTWMACSPS